MEGLLVAYCAAGGVGQPYGGVSPRLEVEAAWISLVCVTLSPLGEVMGLGKWLWGKTRTLQV